MGPVEKAMRNYGVDAMNGHDVVISLCTSTSVLVRRHLAHRAKSHSGRLPGHLPLRGGGQRLLAAQALCGSTRKSRAHYEWRPWQRRRTLPAECHACRVSHQREQSSLGVARDPRLLAEADRAHNESGKTGAVQ